MSVQQEKFREIADAIRAQTGEVRPIKPSEFASEISILYTKTYEAGSANGKQAEYDAFWDNVQKNGNRTYYSFGFSGEGWNDTTFKPKYNITPSEANSMFQVTAITDFVDILEKQGVTLDTSKATTIQNMFAGSFHVTKVPKIDASGVTSSTGCAGVFNSCTALEEVEEFVFNADVTNYLSFVHWCTSLKKFKASGTIGSSISFDRTSKLDKESITSVIEHLSDSTSGQTFSIKGLAVDNAFETSSGAADGRNSDEWAALIATKPNWTISLV